MILDGVNFEGHLKNIESNDQKNVRILNPMEF